MPSVYVAAEAGLTLAGFLRGPSMSVYAGARWPLAWRAWPGCWRAHAGAELAPLMGVGVRPKMGDWLSEQRPLAGCQRRGWEGAQGHGSWPGCFRAWFVVAREFVGLVGGPVPRVRL